MSNDDDDDVGYGRPPKKHQFKKGTSGCPDGGWEQRRKNQNKRAKDEKEKNVRLADRLNESICKLRRVRVDGELVEMSNLEYVFNRLQEAAHSDPAARRLYFYLVEKLDHLKPTPPRSTQGVVVVRQPARTIEEFMEIAKAMPPLPLNPLEGLPGINAETLRKPKRPKTPDDDSD